MSFITSLTYKSAKFIEIHNWKLAVLFYITQVFLFVYVVAYTIIIQKGYQRAEPLIGTLDWKMKGVAVSSASGEVWDSHDIVIPPLEPNALFIATRYKITRNQTKAICPGFEADDACDEKGYCKPGQQTYSGIKTGKCLKEYSSKDFPNGVCEVESWCPQEDMPGAAEDGTLLGVERMTLFIRVDTEFPAFDVKLTNANGSTLTWNYNLFYVGDVVQVALNQENFGQVSQDPPQLPNPDVMTPIQSRGAILYMNLHYDCNLDQDISKCIPKMSVFRVDDPESKISSGFNYRFTRWYNDGSTKTRDLIKVYGVRMMFNVYGVGRKFDIIALSVNFGAGLGLLAIATVICDIIAQYFLPGGKSNMVLQSKYEPLVDLSERESCGSDLKEALLTQKA